MEYFGKVVWIRVLGYYNTSDSDNLKSGQDHVQVTAESNTSSRCRAVPLGFRVFMPVIPEA